MGKQFCVQTIEEVLDYFRPLMDVVDGPDDPVANEEMRLYTDVVEMKAQLTNVLI